MPGTRFKHALAFTDAPPQGHHVPKRLRGGVVVLSLSTVSSTAQFLVGVIIQHSTVKSIRLRMARSIKLLTAHTLVVNIHISAVLFHTAGETLTQVTRL